MRRKIDKYDYDELNDAVSILTAIGMPEELRNPRCVMTLVAFAEAASKKWGKLSETYKDTHYIKEYINKYYPNKAGLDSKGYSENSRETFRKYTIYPWIEAGILERKPGLATNDKNNAYRLTSYAAALFRCYGTNRWNEELEAYLKTHKSYIDIQKQVKAIDLGYEIDYGNLSFSLGRSPHNKLQKLILEKFARYFAPGAELLYIGDTADKTLCKNDERMKELGIDIFEQTSKIPDIILYDSKNNRVLLIEAYNSTGEFSIDRVNQIKESLNLSSDTEIAFITAFLDTSKMLKVYKKIAWDTDIWVAEDETHMTHKNGDKFIGRKLDGNN
jgi:hypothetical protein